jgi:RNA polymerase sigma factor (sigma-70 family)
MADSLDDWFRREILVHEDMLVGFIVRVWPRRDERDDIRAETYARVYEAALTQRPRSPKAFLFTTARNLMADRVRRERIVSITAAGETDYWNVLVDEISPEPRVSANQELVRLARAFDRLPETCREVLWLRRVHDLSQREVAEKLGLTEKAIEKRVAKAGRLLAQYLRSNSLLHRARTALSSTASQAGVVEDQDEVEHGQGD